MKRIVLSLLGMAIVLALAWIAGFDFNERGPLAVLVAIYALAGAVVGWVLPVSLRAITE